MLVYILNILTNLFSVYVSGASSRLSENRPSVFDDLSVGVICIIGFMAASDDTVNVCSMPGRCTEGAYRHLQVEGMRVQLCSVHALKFTLCKHENISTHALGYVSDFYGYL